jgi:hypothetical protein
MGYSFRYCRPQSGSLACNGVAFTAFTGWMVGELERGESGPFPGLSMSCPSSTPTAPGLACQL